MSRLASTPRESAASGIFLPSPPRGEGSGVRGSAWDIPSPPPPTPPPSGERGTGERAIGRLVRDGLLVVLVALGACAAPAPAAAVPASHLAWARKVEGRLSYGMYFRGKKVGWVVEEMKLGKHGGKDVL